MLYFIPFVFALLAPAALSSSVSDVPRCWRNCVESNVDYHCRGDWDVSCICSPGTLNLLPATIACARDNCGKKGRGRPQDDDDEDDSEDEGGFNINLILKPLQLACKVINKPIPASVIRSCEVAAIATATATATAPAQPPAAQATNKPATPTPAPAPEQRPAPSDETHALSQTAINGAGQTYVVGIPVAATPSATAVEEASTTATVVESAVPSTIINEGASSTYVQLVTLRVTPSPVSSDAPWVSTTSSGRGAQSTTGGSPFEGQGSADVLVPRCMMLLLLGVMGLCMVVT